MTTIFEGSQKFGSISGDQARVTAIEDRVLIRAIDAMDEEAVTIAMTPDQARALAAGIVAAAENAEAHPMTRDEALIRTALEMAAAEAEECGTCAVCGDRFVASAAIRSIDPAEVLEKVGEVETTPAPDAIARLVEAVQFARNRLEVIASDAWNGNARDFKRSLIGVFAEFNEAIAEMGANDDHA